MFVCRSRLAGRSHAGYWRGRTQNWYSHQVSGFRTCPTGCGSLGCWSDGVVSRVYLTQGNGEDELKIGIHTQCQAFGPAHEVVVCVDHPKSGTKSIPPHPEKLCPYRVPGQRLKIEIDRYIFITVVGQGARLTQPETADRHIAEALKRADGLQIGCLTERLTRSKL